MSTKNKNKQKQTNGYSTHVFWENFKDGAIKTAKWTVKCGAWGGGACSVIGTVPLLIIFAPGFAKVLALTCIFAPESLLVILPILFILGMPIGAVIGGILSLATAPLGGLINGACAVFNKKMHESQKRQEANTSPLAVENEGNQLPSIQSACLRCNTQPAVNTAEKKSWFSFWKPSDATAAPPAEDVARVLSHSHF